LKPAVLLFDIGDVLVDFVGPEKLCALLNGRFTLDQIRQMWPQSPALRKFELGRLSAQHFAEEFTAEWDLDMSADALLREFSTWVRAPLAGALSLLDALREVAILACLTNMNATYWERIRDDMGFGSRFDRCYASHETGLLKPDAEAFRYVISDLSCEPGEILFFDDTWNNVAAARALGIRAFQIDGVSELRACLERELDEYPS
jgi:putative hydrolase of the HAD superfamily